MAYDYDLFTIGAGSGGVRASRLASLSGASVAIAEEYRVGGTCVIRGCVPKKFMVYASEFPQIFDGAKGFGWQFENAHFDYEQFMERMHAEVDRLSGIYMRNLNNAGVTVFEERAELVDAHTVRLCKSGKTVTAERILIAAGGTPWLPEPEELPGVEHVITSDDVFHLKTLPKRMIIAGGGYIAVEFAGVFAGIGVDTTLVYRGETVLRGFDDDVRIHVHEGLKEKGVRVITQTVFETIEKQEDDRLCAKLTNGMELEADVIMMAVGRRPITKGLGCEPLGIDLSDNGAIKVDEYSRTNVDSIWAVGDVTDRMNLTPVAIREGQAFAETEFYDRPKTFDYDYIPTAVFSQPPVGTVGLSEVEARRKYKKIDVYRSKFRPMKDMLTGHEERVLMKIIVRQEDDVIVGCHIVGPDAPEIIQGVGIAVKMGATKEDFDRTCALHPSIAEELVTMREKVKPDEGLN